MATNLIAGLMNEFRGDTLNRVASALGESPARTESALGGVLPALMGGLIGKASTSAGAGEFLDLIRRSKLDSRQYADPASAMTAPDGLTSLMNAGRPLLDFVLGGRAGSVTDWISSFAGVNRSSSTSLLTMALPLLIGQIGKYVGGGGLTAASLQNLLTEQKTFLKDAPAGLSNALGVADFGRTPVVGTERVEATPRPAARAVSTYDRDTREGGGSWKWAIPLLLLALIPLFFLLRRPEAPRTTVQTPRAEVPTTGTAPVGHLGDFVDRRLPRGVMIRVPAAGVESKLIGFIDDRNARLDKETWFSFDRLEFETDSAVLKPSSQEQVRNVAEILKAYPNVNVKIGGYTDNVGDDNYNLKLSADRATNTANAISALGVEHARLESEGYGENHPIADNGTAEGRQRNRRIDILVTKK